MSANDPSTTLAELWQRFAQADCCWFSSVRPDGRVHLAPVWHVVYQAAIYVVSTPNSVRVRNIAHNPAVSLSLPDPMDVLIFEGTARLVAQGAETVETAEALRPLFQAQYNWDIGTDSSYTAIIQVQPAKIMAWGGVHGDVRLRLSDTQ